MLKEKEKQRNDVAVDTGEKRMRNDQTAKADSHPYSRRIRLNNSARTGWKFKVGLWMTQMFQSRMPMNWSPM